MEAFRFTSTNKGLDAAGVVPPLGFTKCPSGTSPNLKHSPLCAPLIPAINHFPSAIPGRSFLTVFLPERSDRAGLLQCIINMLFYGPAVEVHDAAHGFE
jgi:hypothetical protein